MDHEGIFQKLIPSNQALASTIVDFTHESESQHSTVTTEYGKTLTARLKSQDSSHKHQHLLPEDNHFKYNSKQTRVFPGRIRKRVVLKNGSVNLSPERVEKRSQRYLQDTFTTMVDIQWRWNLLVFSMGFVLSWLGFAVVWYIICYAHGDFDSVNKDGKVVKCVNGIESFASAFLFSIETQHTIGYGSRYTTEECPEAIFVMCVQSITGVMIQCFVVGFVFAKLSRPKKRLQTLMFSRNSVICLRDGKLCLMFRVGDVRNRSHIIGATVSSLVIDRKVTLETEVIPFYHNKLEVKFDNSDFNVFLVWPAIIVHEINSSSPFYLMSAEELMRAKFEIVVILEGTVESTGQSIQARTSYLPCEILWGHRFVQMVDYRKDTGQYRVDYSKFNNTYEVNAPTCSAKDYYDYQHYLNQNLSFCRTFTPMDIVSKESDESKMSSGDSGFGNTNLCLVPFSRKS